MRKIRGRGFEGYREAAIKFDIKAIKKDVEEKEFRCCRAEGGV